MSLSSRLPWTSCNNPGPKPQAGADTSRNPTVTARNIVVVCIRSPVTDVGVHAIFRVVESCLDGRHGGVLDRSRTRTVSSRACHVRFLTKAPSDSNSTLRPLCPRKRTFAVQRRMSAKCHKRTFIRFPHRRRQAATASKKHDGYRYPKGRRLVPFGTGDLMRKCREKKIVERCDRPTRVIGRAMSAKSVGCRRKFRNHIFLWVLNTSVQTWR